MRITPAKELTVRAIALQQLLREQGIAAAFLVQSSDLFYFTGSIQQGIYYLPADGEPIYLVRKDFGRARMESGLKNVIPLGSMRQFLEQLTTHEMPFPDRVGLELDVLTVLQYREYQKFLAPAELVDISNLIRRVRAVKSDYEIGIMKDCALIMDKVFQYAKEVVAAGKMDLEVIA